VQTFSGTLAPGAEKTFKVRAKVGKYINAVITSEKGNVKIAEEEGATELTAEVVDDGYELVIYNRGKRAEEYKLTVTVYTPEPEPPERIEFRNGETEKEIGLRLNPYKLKHRFSIELKKGWTFKISASSEQIARRLIFGEEKIEDVDQAEGGSGTLWIRAGRDGVFHFQVTKTDEKLFEGNLIVRLSRSEKDPVY